MFKTRAKKQSMPLSNLPHPRFADIVFGGIVSMSHPSKSSCGPGSECTKLVAKSDDFSNQLGLDRRESQTFSSHFDQEALMRLQNALIIEYFERCKIWSFHRRV